MARVAPPQRGVRRTRRWRCASESGACRTSDRNDRPAGSEESDGSTGGTAILGSASDSSFEN